ncbi:hypothetical protein NGG61_13665 [Enterococcus casseliflavus]|uniref:hypothetical protein n=1 Tax=Enterococcus casseliflavus TaxID=37734 RepID=UPI002DBBF5EE|nr:hypothetical protein [Enterococcus casseliflavus]MEB8400970.1 hypothetical protein [Enterococcus casseliflavus]
MSDLYSIVSDIRIGAGDHKDSKCDHEEVEAFKEYVLELIKDNEQPQLNENQIKTIKSWGNLAAGEFGQEWTEDDELTYRELFGESLMALPEELDGADCGFEEEE